MTDEKISQLPIATSVASPDVVPIVQGGVTKQADVFLIAKQYADVVLDPVQLTTAPFVDTGFTGPGIKVIDAPGEGLSVWPIYFDFCPAPGEAWAGGDSNRSLPVTFCYRDVPIGTNEGTKWEANDSGSLADKADPLYPFYSPRRFLAQDINRDFVVNDPSVVVNAPLVMFVPSANYFDLGIGSRSLRIRITYEIIPITQLVSFDYSFFRISATNQGTKTFTVADPYEQAIASLGATFTVVGSTGNNGTYTKVSATFIADHTDIVVSEAIPNATADGWVKN
jgi:hypothetical protein